MTAKRPGDVNSLAKQIAEEATGEAEPQRDAPKKSEAAVQRGKARAKKLSPEERSEIASPDGDNRDD
jgi:hypothetical protein